MKLSLQNIFVMITLLAMLGSVFAFSVASPVFAQTFNQQINYQGKLATPAGVAVSDGTYSMVFRLYNVASGGSNIWSETQTVTVTDGLFSVMLGSSTSLASVDFAQTLYLGINVDADGEMTPRKILGAVPAAFEANNAQTLDNIATSSFLRSDIADIASNLITFAGGFISSGSSTISELTTGTTTVTTFLIDGESYTTFDGVGSGLVNNSGTLTTNISESNLNIAGSPTNNYLLQASSTAAGGFVWAATSSLGFAAAGTESLFTDGGATTYLTSLSDRLAIGTTTSTRLLEVYGAANAGGRFIDSTNDVTVDVRAEDFQGFIGTVSNSDLRFITNNTSQMTLDTSGNFGIGTTSPNAKLAVVGDAQVTGLVTVEGTGTSTFSDNVHVQGDLRVGNSSLLLNTNSLMASAGFTLGSAGAMSLVADGNLNITSESDAITFNQYAPPAGLSVTSTTSDSGFGPFNNSFSHTVPVEDTSRLLVVTMSFTSESPSIAMSGVTYGGVSMTKIDGASVKRVDGSVDHETSAWYLVNPPTGTNNVTVSYTGGSDVIYQRSAISFAGANQVSPIGDVDAQTNVGTPSLTMTNESTDYVVDVLVARDDRTPNGGQIAVTDYFATNQYGSSYRTGAADVTMGWSTGFANRTAYGAFVVRPEASSFLERARFAANGNFGIGTTSPNSKLSVVGDVYTTDTISFDDNNPDSGIIFPGDNFKAHSSWKSMPVDTGILLPMYVYPSSVYTNTDYNNVINLKKKYSEVPLYVILNPANGAGNVTDGNYTAAIQRLKGAGAVVLGYIATNYTASSTSEMETEIDKWLTYYPDVDGIFMDEMDNTNDDATRSYYQTVTRYVHEQGLYPAIGNPGAGVAGNFFASSTADVIVTYENSSYPTEATLEGDFDNGYSDYDKAQRAALAYDSDQFYAASTTLLKKHNGLIYVTDDTLPNPWDTLSPYMEELFEILSSENSRYFADLTVDGRFSVGTTTLSQKLTVSGNMRLTGSLFDSVNSAGTNGMVLQTTAAGTQWVATSSLGFTDTDTTLTAGADNQIPFTNAGGTDFEYSSGFTYNGTDLNLGATNGLAFGGTRYLYASSTNDTVAIGEDAGTLNTGSNNNLFGRNAGSDNTGNGNNIFGYFAGSANTGNYNNIFGTQAGLNNTGAYNSFIGDQAGYNNTGSFNYFAGISAGRDNEGSYNNFIGNQAGRNNTGSYTQFIGFETGARMSATNTVAIGGLALRGGSGSVLSLGANTANNTVIGYGAGYNVLTGGDNNLLLGYQAADSLTTGANNIIIGYDVEAPSNTGSNQLNIGNLLFGAGIDGTGTTLSSGNIGIGTTTPYTKLDVQGGIFSGNDSAGKAAFSADSERIGIGNFNEISSATLDSQSYGLINGVNITAAQTGTSNAVYGSRSLVSVEGAGSANSMVGSSASVGILKNTTVPAMVGVSSVLQNMGVGAIGTNVYGFKVDDISNFGTFTNTYGVHVGDITDGTQTNTPFSFYASDAGAYNYFAGDVGIGTTTPTQKLTVSGNLRLTGALYDSSNSAGTAGMVLQTTVTGTQWVATSSLGFGSSVTFGADNQVPFMNAAGDDFEYSSGFTYNGTNLNLAAGNGIAFGGTRYLHADATNDSIAFGEYAGATFGAGTTHNVALGFEAGRYASTSDADENNYIGRQAGYNNTGGTNNLFGAYAGYGNTGFFNNMLGQNAGAENTGAYNILIGGLAGYGNIGGNNVFVGELAGRDNEGDDGVFLGTSAGQNNTGSFSNMFGSYSGQNSTGSDNNLIGRFSGQNSTGSYNNILGNAAGQDGTGSYNNILGNAAGRNNTGSYSEFLGFETAGRMSASYTVAIGGQALRGGLGETYDGNAATTTNNTVIGYGAGRSALTGADNNILLGYQAANSLTTGANNIIIGYDVEAPSNSGSNQLNIGNLIFGTGIDGTGTSLSSGNIGIGTTTPEGRLSIQNTGVSGAGVVGIDQYLGTANSVAAAVQYGNRSYFNAANTATTTIVGNMYRLADNTTFGNTVRGLEVQTNRGSNTQGENTALSGFARTFGVRGVTSGDAGGSFEPAGGFFETEGTTQGNAIRGYSDSITSATLLSLFQDTSAFTGTGLEMNFGNTTGSFSSSSSKYLDFQNGGSSVFTVSAYGTTTIGDGTTNNMAGLQIGFGGICVDNDGSCTASTTGRISAVSYETGNSDLAENYFSSQSLQTGEIVTMSGGLSVVRAEKDAALPILGVVSTKPGLTMGYDDSSLRAGETAYPIALTGRVPVQLSTENGPIKKGDQLMLSSLPGVAMKATGTGATIGIALEDFTESRMYSDTYLNQFGDDMVDPIYEPVVSNTDTRINDGCYYGGGNATGEEACVPLSATTSAGQINEVNDRLAQESVAEQIEALKGVRSQTKRVDGESVKVGQVVMFVQNGHRWVDEDQLAQMNTLFATSSVAQLGENESETLFDRLVALADNFIDGVLNIAGLKADKVETSELCIDDVCVDSNQLRALLEASNNNDQTVEVIPVPTEDEEESTPEPEEDEEETQSPEPPVEENTDATSTEPVATSTPETPPETATSTPSTNESDAEPEESTPPEPPAEDEPIPEPNVEEEPLADEDSEPEPEPSVEAEPDPEPEESTPPESNESPL